MEIYSIADRKGTKDKKAGELAAPRPSLLILYI